MVSWLVHEFLPPLHKLPPLHQLHRAQKLSKSWDKNPRGQNLRVRDQKPMDQNLSSKSTKSQNSMDLNSKNSKKSQKIHFKYSILIILLAAFVILTFTLNFLTSKIVSDPVCEKACCKICTSVFCETEIPLHDSHSQARSTYTCHVSNSACFMLNLQTSPKKQARAISLKCQRNLMRRHDFCFKISNIANSVDYPPLFLLGKYLVLQRKKTFKSEALNIECCEEYDKVVDLLQKNHAL